LCFLSGFFLFTYFLHLGTSINFVSKSSFIFQSGFFYPKPFPSYCVFESLDANSEVL
jgi:hypothetical protein